MRSLGCIINDVADRDLDRHVKRTHMRPLATGELSLRAVLVYGGIIALIPLYICIVILPRTAQYVAGVAFLALLAYPFTKRFTHYPQFFLGLAYTSGLLIAWLCFETSIPSTLIWLYAAGVLWTVLYDTVYAFQDVDDDIAYGNKSTAVRFKKYPKFFIFVCGVGMMLCLTCAERSLLCRAWVAFSLLWIIIRWDPKDSTNCMKRFKECAWLSIWGIL
jgi:4-hydroxybenzoate polyprenyltransferase